MAAKRKPEPKPEPVPLDEGEKAMLRDLREHLRLQELFQYNYHGQVAQLCKADRGEFRALEMCIHLRLAELRRRIKGQLRISANQRMTRKPGESGKPAVGLSTRRHR